MDKVPQMISTKDLMYISDLFEHNFLIGKTANHFMKEITNPEVKEIISNAALMHKNNCQKFINMLGGTNE